MMQDTFRSGLANDALRYIALKQTLGRRFENSIRVLANLDAFLLGFGNPPVDLTAATFGKWMQTLSHLSANTKLARMRVARNFCIYRRRLVPACFIPDPCLFPTMSAAAPIYLF